MPVPKKPCLIQFPVHQLLELKKVLESHKVVVSEFTGWSIKTKTGDTWTLANEVFYKNGEPVIEKEKEKESKSSSEVKTPSLSDSDKKVVIEEPVIEEENEKATNANKLRRKAKADRRAAKLAAVVAMNKASKLTNNEGSGRNRKTRKQKNRKQKFTRKQK